MGKLRESKGLYIAMSIILAIIFWAYVRVEQDAERSLTFRNLAVMTSGSDVLESRGLMVSEISPESVSITFSGATSVMSELRRTAPTISVDLSRITAAGEYSLAYTINYPGSVSPYSITNRREISNITVTVVPLYSREITIESTFVGEVAEGYQAGELTISPETITVSGEEALVRQVARAVVEVGGENLEKTFTGELPVTLLDEEGNMISNTELRCSADSVFVTLPVVVVKEIPLTVDLIAGGGITADTINDYVTCRIEPEYISVAGAAEDMAALSEISLGEIDLSKLFTSSTQTFPINLSSELTNASGVTQATVTVTIQGLDMLTFSVDNIDLINVSSGYSATAVTQSLEVQLRGPQESLEGISVSQIRVVGDLEDIVSATGRYTVPAKVYLDGPADVGVVGEYSIVVQVTR